MRVGVRALESGVVPRNLITLVGRTSANQVSRDMAALFARRLVLPQPPRRENKNENNGHSVGQRSFCCFIIYLLRITPVVCQIYFSYSLQ